MKLVVIRNGSAFLLGELGTRHVKTGDVLILASQTLYGAEPEGRITTTTIYLDPEYLIDQVFWQYATQFCDRHNARDFFDIHYWASPQIVRIGEDRAGFLIPWLDELSRLSLDGPDPMKFHRTQALLFSVLDVIAPFMSKTTDASSVCGGNASVPAALRHRQFKPLRMEARHIAQLIRGNPTRHWTVQELAEAAHLSPSQLRRVFVEAFGKAPIAYLTMVRTERMAKLLRSTKLSVKRIAAQVGWADADFAARQFRRGLGVTPTAYRQITCASDSDDAA